MLIDLRINELNSDKSSSFFEFNCAMDLDFFLVNDALLTAIDRKN